MFLLTTTGNTASVVLDDLGERIFSHPTTDFNLESEYNIFLLISSSDIQTSINSGYITITDGVNTITDLSNFFMPSHIYDINGDNIVDNSSKLSGSSASVYLDASNLTGTINTNVLTGSGAVESVNGQTGSVIIDTSVINNQIIVNSISDFPIPSGGKYSLAADTKYFLTTPLTIGNDYIEMSNNSMIDSINKQTTTITYTGTGSAIRGTNINAVLREVKVDGAEKGFDFTGTGSQVLNIFQSSFDNCTKIGTVSGLSTFSYKNNVHVGNSDGVTITNPNTGAGANIIIDGCTFYSNNTGNFIDIPSGTYNGVRISNLNMDVTSGSVGLNINELGITIEQKMVLMNNILLGTATTKIAGFNPLNGDIKSANNEGIKNNETHSSITSTEMFEISNPTTGLPFFNTTLNELVYWDGVKWDSISDSVIFSEILIADFETGLDGFVLVNNGNNDWIRGTDSPKSGTYSLYISNDGSTNNYSNSSSLDVSHAYIDILLPTVISQLAISFDWLCEGEVNYDAMMVFDVPTSTTPVADTELTSGQIGLSQYNNKLSFGNSQIALPIGESNTTRRFVFSWRNDSSVNNQPPIKIDNVKILYA